jgi:hypothetical protein
MLITFAGCKLAMEDQGEGMRASLTNGDSLENGHVEESNKDGKVLKVKKVKAKVDKEKKTKRDKNGTIS